MCIKLFCSLLLLTGIGAYAGEVNNEQPIERKVRKFPVLPRNNVMAAVQMGAYLDYLSKPDEKPEPKA